VPHFKASKVRLNSLAKMLLGTANQNIRVILLKKKLEGSHEYYQSFTSSSVDVLCIMSGMTEVIYGNQFFCHFVSEVEK
jgi:hypothetical protein